MYTHTYACIHISMHRYSVATSLAIYRQELKAVKAEIEAFKRVPCLGRNMAGGKKAKTAIQEI